MNKDVKGLIIYLSLIIFVMLLPEIYFITGIMTPVNEANEKLVNTIFFTAAIFFVFLYILIPMIITHYAIKKHWSIYLDWFFNQWLCPSLILITLLLLPITLKVDDVAKVSWNFSVFLYDFYFGAIPCYCLIYIVIFWHNLWRLVRKIVKFIHEKL